MFPNGQVTFHDYNILNDFLYNLMITGKKTSYLYNFVPNKVHFLMKILSY